jgi:hypothetical protein
MSYHHDEFLYKRWKRSKRLFKASLALSMFAVIIVGFIFGDWVLQSLRSDTVVSSSSKSNVQSANINIFQTPYFRFQANDTWREVNDEFSNPVDEYIYRSIDDGLIKHELWISVSSEKKFNIQKHYPTRVVPVRIEQDGRLSQIGGVSDRCFEALPEGDTNQDPRVLTQKGVTYFCHPNSTAYNVTVGVPGDTNLLKFESTNGDVVPITIIYKNVTAYPEARQLEQILNTFRIN